MPVSPATFTGVFLCTWFPSPSLPFVPDPQHLALELVRTAQVCISPADTCTPSAIPDTSTGVLRCVPPPSPSWPLPPCPQQAMLLFRITTHEVVP